MMRARPAPAPTPTAAELLEEAVHLLRNHPGELGGYYAGTATCAIAFLYFWSFVTWFRPADGEVAFWAALLALLYGVMLAAQHRFALALRAKLTGDPVARWTLGRWRTEFAAQLRLQATSLFVLPLAAVFAVPFGWALAYFQSAIVAPAEQPEDTGARRRAAWAFACQWPGQNHRGLAMLAVLWGMVFVNVGFAFYFVPALASRWLGLETIFLLQGWNYLNTTFLTLVAVLTQLLVGPLIRAFYVLRVFRSSALTTGADLRLVLRREQAARRTVRGVWTGAVLWLAALAFPGEVRSEVVPASTRATASISAEELDQQLDRVLQQRDYRWRLQPLSPPPEQANEGLIKGVVRATFDFVREVIATVRGWYRRAEGWVRDWFPGESKTQPKAPQPAGAASFAWMNTLQLVAYGLLVVIAGLLLFVAWKVWRHRREFAIESGGGVVAAATPDLRDEAVEASRLPAHEWIELARAQLAAGEWRLAMRALFLATIATHAHDGLVTLAKFKTNLDYERELRRRARSRAEVVEEFRDRRRQFESVWYGAEPAREETAVAWLRRLEGGAS